MMKRNSLLLASAVVAVCVLPVGNALAVPLILDYLGFAWVSPGLVPNHLSSVGVVDGFSLPVNDPNEVYTYYLSNLDLSSIVNYPGNRHTYVYSGGTFGIYRSTDVSNRGYDYGVNPANPTSPSTFTDGVSWLAGSLSSFNLYFDDTLRLGTLSAEGTFSSGEMFDALDPASFFTFSGVTARPGSGIPQGYKYRLDGQTDMTLDSVPEPAAALLVAVGLLGLGAARLMRRRIS
jgi:hypothetical protein